MISALVAGITVRHTGAVTRRGGPHDEELADDLVGVASARLAAMGVPRGERLRALRLLSVLATLADTDDCVRRPLAMVASEFELPPDEVERWLDHLLAVGVVQREGPSIVLGGREPHRDVGITLHDFLDAAAPPARSRWTRALLRPSGAVLAAAAVVAVALVAPGVIDDDSRPVSTSRTPDVPTTVAGDPPSTTSTTTSTPAAPGSSAARAPAPLVGPVEGGERIGPVVVSTTTSTLLPCPVDVPALETLGTTTVADGRLAVDGVARNSSGHRVRIQSFTVRTTVAGREMSVPGLLRPLVVPPRGEVLWQSLLPILAPPGTSVRLTLGEWEWLGLDDGLDCPSP